MLSIFILLKGWEYVLLRWVVILLRDILKVFIIIRFLLVFMVGLNTAPYMINILE